MSTSLEKKKIIDTVSPPPRISVLFPDKETFILFAARGIQEIKDLTPPFHIFIDVDGEGFLRNETENIPDFLASLYKFYRQRGIAIMHKKLLAGTDKISALLTLYSHAPERSRIWFTVDQKKKIETDAFLGRCRELIVERTNLYNKLLLENELYIGLDGEANFEDKYFLAKKYFNRI